MSDQWLYRIQGQEYGPVSLELVRSLVASGTIALDDEVRHFDRTNWILACAASELRTSAQQQSINLAFERRHKRDEWYCRGATGDYGPLKLADLIELAVRGELSPDEEIKSRVDDYWRQIHTIDRLLELLPFPDEIREISNAYSRQALSHAPHLSIYQEHDAVSTTSPSTSSSRDNELKVSSDLFDMALMEVQSNHAISSIIPFPGCSMSSDSEMNEESTVS